MNVPQLLVLAAVADGFHSFDGILEGGSAVGLGQLFTG